MRQETTTLKLQTHGQGLLDITSPIQRWLMEKTIKTGVLTVFCRHTSASLTIQENADPDVVSDLNAYFCALVPEDHGRYRHRSEGPDDMPAHIKATLTDVSLSIPVVDGRAVLGTWQGIYLFEHRSRGQPREVVLHVMGQ